MRMKRALIITYYWPPAGGSGVQRWLKFSKYLPEFGWKPVIYTPSNPELPAIDNSLEKDIPSEIEVIKREIVEPYSLYRTILKWGRKGPKNGQNNPQSGVVVNPINHSGEKSWKQKLSLWARANLFIPDPRIFWVRPSVKFLLRYIQEHPVDVIVSTGPPHSMHLIAKKLHQKSGVKWIADFRDPWTEIFYFKHLPMLPCVRRIHKKLEKGVLTGADCVVSVSSQMTQNFSKCGLSKYGESSTNGARYYTISNGYDESDFSSAPQRVPDSKFTILHTGLFSADGNPKNLWSVLAAICEQNPKFKEDLRIKLVGKVDREVIESIEIAGLESCLEDLGYLPHSEIPSLQRNCWVLLLPLREEPESKGILTGKFFEYLAAQRPILAFGPKDGEVAKVLDETASGNIYEWSEKGELTQKVMVLYQRYTNTERIDEETSINSTPSTILKYSRRYLTKEMVALFESPLEDNIKKDV